MSSLPAGYRPLATRAERRAVSRRTARQQATSMHTFLGTTPRYEPAQDTTCEEHHRRKPCTRCGRIAPISDAMIAAGSQAAEGFAEGLNKSTRRTT